jgi:hypothetical protein
MDIRKLTTLITDREPPGPPPPVIPVEEPTVIESWLKGYQFANASFN